MKDSYIDKKAAEAILENLQWEMGLKFCPLIRENCYGPVCMSYSPGKIVQYQSGKPSKLEWRVWGPECLSTLVSGQVGTYEV